MPEMLIENTNNIIMLKYNSVLGSTGKGIENYELEAVDNVAIDATLLNAIDANYKYTELIKSSGESMHPLIPDNSIVFIDKSKKDISNNKVYCILHKDELYIKRIVKKDNKYIARSINKEFEDFILDEFKVIGRVVGVMYKV